MGVLTEPIQAFVDEVRQAVERETTIDRFLRSTREALQGFMARPDCLEGLGIDPGSFGTWTIYTDPEYDFCLHASHQKPNHRRGVHDHGVLGWAIYGVREGEAWQEIYERVDDGSTPGRASMRLAERVDQRAGDALIIPVGTAHRPGNDSPTGSWNVVIRSSDLSRSWRNSYDIEAGTVRRFRGKT